MEIILYRITEKRFVDLKWTYTRLVNSIITPILNSQLLMSMLICEVGPYTTIFPNKFLSFGTYGLVDINQGGSFKEVLLAPIMKPNDLEQKPFLQRTGFWDFQPVLIPPLDSLKLWRFWVYLETEARVVHRYVGYFTDFIILPSIPGSDVMSQAKPHESKHS